MQRRETQPSLHDDRVVELINIQLVKIDGVYVSCDVQQRIVADASADQRELGVPTHGVTEVSDRLRRTLGRWIWLLRMRRNIPPLQLAEHTGIDAWTLEQLELGFATSLGGSQENGDRDWDRMVRLGHMLTDDVFDADLVVVAVRVILGLSETIPNPLLERIACELNPAPTSRTRR